eukprot:scaffold462_cov195-Pinguiococcus_pyrenoidosus.AAC.56
MDGQPPLRKVEVPSTGPQVIDQAVRHAFLPPPPLSPSSTKPRVAFATASTPQRTGGAAGRLLACP